MQRRTAQPAVVPVWLPQSILRRADARLHHIVTHVLKSPSYTSGIGFGEILKLLLQCSLPSSSRQANTRASAHVLHFAATLMACRSLQYYLCSRCQRITKCRAKLKYEKKGASPKHSGERRDAGTVITQRVF